MIDQKSDSDFPSKTNNTTTSLQLSKVMSLTASTTTISPIKICFQDSTEKENEEVLLYDGAFE